MADELIDTSNLVDVVYRTGVPDLLDPAEEYFEASKLGPSSVMWDLPGVAALERSVELRAMTARGARRYGSAPAVPLPEPAPLHADLAGTLSARRSADTFGGGRVDLAVLTSLLVRSYGLNGQVGSHPLRPTPSGGALYPLDVFLFTRHVAGLAPGHRYHFDPFRTALADLGPVDLAAADDAIGATTPAPGASAVLLVSASFWRSRFKYGQRALRFALLEAGHLVQNILLLATGHGLAARPMGGFFDDGLTRLLPDHNGVDDAPIYAVLLGTNAAA